MARGSLVLFRSTPTAEKGFLRPEAARTASGRIIFHQADERQMPAGIFTLNLFDIRNKCGY